MNIQELYDEDFWLADLEEHGVEWLPTWFALQREFEDRLEGLEAKI